MSGRPTKQGLDYFPLDVDFFNDEKVEFVSARFGVKGEVIAIRLLCKIYRNGYYTAWNDDESTLLAKRAGDGITPSLVRDIVQELVRRRFFSEPILSSFAILTSPAIQRRYVRAADERKRIEIDRNFWLIEIPKNAVFSDNPPSNSINPPINSINQPINAQSKGKESKEKNPPPFPPPGGGEPPLGLKSQPQADLETGAQPGNGRPLGRKPKSPPPGSAPPPPALPFHSQVFRELWGELVRMPKWAKKPAASLEKSLARLGRYDEAFACELISRAIEGNYQGVVFPNTDADYAQWCRRRDDGRVLRPIDDKRKKLLEGWK